jgi:polysaccharide deacetylase family protein (PEP-CTERM system associated)
MSHSRTTSGAQCVFSVDVEDWFHILDLPSTPSVPEWESLPSCVERNFRRLLEVFERHDARVTCFFLGWIAERFPELVKEAVQQGHEVASHGYAHQLAYQMTPETFYQDALRSKKLLEDISGKEVLGYRSAGFSVTRGNEWLWEKLLEAGYLYDSSVFPAARGHGGMAGATRVPHWIERPTGSLFEFPVTVTDILGVPCCFFGGGYLRLFPYFVVRRMTRRALKETSVVVFYVHPREIDPSHPRLPMSWKRRLKSYVNLKSTMPKIERILTEFPVSSFENLIRGAALGTAAEMGDVSSLQRLKFQKTVHTQSEMTPEVSSEI